MWPLKKNSKESPIALLITEINVVAYTCADHFKEIIDEKYGKGSNDAQYKLVNVYYEFLFFFLHMTNRIAFRELGSKKRNQLQDAISPIIDSLAIEYFFSDAPEDAKANLTKAFYTQLNMAEDGYADCTELFDPEKPFTSNTLFSKLARVIADSVGYPTNPEVFRQCIEISTKTFGDMKLIELVNAAGKEL